MPSLSRKLAPVVLVVLSALLPASSRANLIWQTDIGAEIPLSSFTYDASGGLLTENLNFSFPFEGTDYTSPTLATSGFVWLSGVNTAQGTVVDNSTDALDAFEGSPARIAPVWYDLRPDLGTSAAIYFNQLTIGTTSEAVFTFVDVPSDTSTTDPATFQLQLFSTGEIIFSYMTLDSASLGSDNGVMIGLTSTANFSPMAIDLESVLAGNAVTTSNTGIYDYLNRTDNFNLSGQSIVFLPQTGGGWIVDNGVPEPGTLVTTAVVLLLFPILSIRQRRMTKY